MGASEFDFAWKKGLVDVLDLRNTGLGGNGFGFRRDTC